MHGRGRVATGTKTVNVVDLPRELCGFRLSFVLCPMFPVTVWLGSALHMSRAVTCTLTCNAVLDSIVCVLAPLGIAESCASIFPAPSAYVGISCMADERSNSLTASSAVLPSQL